MRYLLMGSVCMLAASMAQANVISWNHNYWGDSHGADASTSFAGVTNVAYWNDSWMDEGNQTVPGSYADLRDNTGAATTMDISWNGAGQWGVLGQGSPSNYPDLDADGTYNKKILNGYVDSASPSKSSVSLSQISYAQYDIIVYFGSDTSTREGSVTDGSTSYYFGILDNMLAGGNALFAQTTSTDIAVHTEANYAVFSGLTGSSQTITTDIVGGGGISGIQIVQIPEPATIGLFGLFGAIILFGRRRLMRLN